MIDELLTFVNVGIAARANPRKPCVAIQSTFGINPRAIAASKYSSELPSKQITAIGPASGEYSRPLAVNEVRAALISSHANTCPGAREQVTVMGTVTFRARRRTAIPFAQAGMRGVS